MAIDYICRECGYDGKSQMIKQGSGKTEMMTWLFFPVGPFYTIWRMFSKKRACRHCKNRDIVSVDSVIGSRLMEIRENDISDKNLSAMDNKTPLSKEDEFKNFKKQMEAGDDPAEDSDATPRPEPKAKPAPRPEPEPKAEPEAEDDDRSKTQKILEDGDAFFKEKNKKAEEERENNKKNTSKKPDSW